MAGLDNIKGYAEGDTVEGGLPLTIGANGKISPTGKIVADSAATADLLKNMEAMIAERSGGWNQFNRGLERASAWGVASEGGQKAQALSNVNKQQNQEDQDVFKMREQLAAYQAAQSSAAKNDARLASILGGGASGIAGAPAAGGTPAIPDDVKARMAAAPDSATALAIRDEWLKGRVTESTKKEFSPQMATVVKVFNPLTNKVEEMTQANAERILNSKPELFRGYSQQPTTTGSSDQAPLSVRNNNPGNLMGSDGQLRKFATAEEGNKAMNDDLALKISGNSPAYKARFGDAPVTPAKLAEVWSPAAAKGNSQESTTNYGAAIAKELGLGPNDPIPNTPQAQAAVARAITKFEAGPGYDKNVVAANTTGTTGLEPAPKQPTAKTTGYNGPLMPDGSKPTTRDEYDLALSNQKLEAEGKIRTNIAGSEATAKELGKSYADTGKAIDESGRQAGGHFARAQTINELSQDKDIKNLIGAFQKGSPQSALVRQLESGLGIGSLGSVGIKELQSNLTKLGATDVQIAKLKRLESAVAENELVFAQQYLKGQGAVSDNERALVQKVVGSVKEGTPEYFKITSQVAMNRASFDKAMYDAYNDYRDAKGDYASPAEFMRSGPAKTLVADYNKKLSNVLNTDVSASQNPYKSGSSGANPPASGGKSKPTWKVVG